MGDWPPETRYARLGEDRIAYQVLGDGPVDLVYAPAFGDAIDLRWEWPAYADFLRRLASFSRLIMFDVRGCGASDRLPDDPLPTWERWADDAAAVLDAVDSERAVLYGSADSGPVAILFAAVFPERTQALILANTTARFVRDDDYPWGLSQGDIKSAVAALKDIWGTDDLAGFGYPDAGKDPDFRRWYAKTTRITLPPGEAHKYHDWMQFTDLRDVLPSIQVPTLVLHRKDFPYISTEQGRYLAEHIPGARLEVVPGADGGLFTEPTADTFRHIEDFLANLPTRQPDRALAAVLFTDVVDSTQRAAEMGDKQWLKVLESHDAVARALVSQHQGRLVKMTGDGVLATFDGPGRAIRCAGALRDALAPLGIEIRAGLHTGEIELRGDDIGGIGVHIAARVTDCADRGELLVSAAVPLLVAGSGIAFDDRGEHDLKGVGQLRLYAVAD